MVVNCLQIAIAKEKNHFVRSTRSLKHLTDYLHLGHKKVSPPTIEIKPSHLVHVSPEFPVWKIHKYSGIQIKPVSTIPYVHVVEAKPNKPKFNLPIEHIQNLLGTTTERETILTLKELASSEEGLKIMANYIKSEYPQSEISETDIVSTLSQYKVKRTSPSHQIYGPPPVTQIYGHSTKKGGPPPHSLIRPSPPQQVYGTPQVSLEIISQPPHQFYELPPQPQSPILHTHHPLALKNFIPTQILKSTLPQSFFHLLTPNNKIPTHPSISQHSAPPPQRYGPPQDIKYLQPQSLITYGPPQPPKEYGILLQQPPREYEPPQQQPLKVYSPPQPQQPQAPKWYTSSPSQPHPSKEYVAHQPQPPKEYGSPIYQPIKEYRVPQAQPPKEYGPPQPSKAYIQNQPLPPKEYGPPQLQPIKEYRIPQLQSSKVYIQNQPQPPKEYGSPQPEPPRSYAQYQPQPPKEYGPPQPKPKKEYGVPQLQSQKVYAQDQSLPPKEFGLSQPTKLNDVESNFGEVYNMPETKDSSFIVKAEPIVVIDSQDTDNIMKEVAFMSTYGPPLTEPPTIEVVESQDDKVEDVINSEEDSNSKVETPKESYGPLKPYAPPAEISKPTPTVPEKTDDLGDRSENEQIEYLTIPQENSDATSEFLPKTIEPEDKHGPPQIVYGNPKPDTMLKEDSEDLQTNENGELLIPPQESNASSFEFRPQQPSNEPAQTYGPPQGFYDIPKMHSMDKEDAEEIQSDKQNVVFNSPEVNGNSSSNYRPFEEYGVPVETSPSKPVFESDKTVYANTYPGYEPTTVGTSEAQKIHSTSLSSPNIPDIIPMSMAANGLKWTDFETGIHSLNDGNDAIQPEKLITGVWDGPPKINFPSAKYQSQQSSFVPTYEPNKFMVAVQQDFYNTNIKPASSGDVKVTQKKINTNGRDVTSLKYDHPNFSYTQLSKVQSSVVPSSSYTRISEIPLENNVNFQNVHDQVSSYGQPLSSYIFGEDTLPAASERKISAVVPEYRKKSDNILKLGQDKSPEGITKGRKSFVKINREPTRRPWVPMSKRKEESRGSE